MRGRSKTRIFGSPDLSARRSGRIGANMQMTKGMTEVLEKDCSRIEDEELRKLYRNCFGCAWETTLERQEDGSTFCITGDIEAMWLRDSSMQVLPYLRVQGDEEVDAAIRGLIRKQAELILMDPYANAFNRRGDYACYARDKTEMGPHIWERKYEVDSLALPLYLLEEYTEKRGNNAVTDTVKQAIRRILDVWRAEQHHENSDYRFERESELFTETLCEEGRGTPVGYTGMTWSGFRPSDDACTYHYPIPANMLAVCVLRRLKELPLERELVEEAAALADEIESGIWKWGVVHHPEYGEIFAYEVDGLGGYILMDDANLPSLLGIPWFGFVGKDHPVWQNTRRFILGRSNPFHYTGKLAKGIGSPHTPDGYVWHIALAVQGLTADTKEEKRELLEVLKNTTAGTGHMHESFHPDRPEEYTRSWFAWADSMFCLLAADYYDL